MENLGYLECLLKLLNGYAFIETHNDIEKTFFLKVTKFILIQIKHMIKFNHGRCEQLAILDGIQILKTLSTSNNFNQILIPIFTEMIGSTRYVRDTLKSHNAIELIFNFISNKNYKEFFSEMIKNLLIWLENDKLYVEVFILNGSNFSNMFMDIHEILSVDLLEYLQILINFFSLSQEIEKKFFDDNLLVKMVWTSMINNNFIKSNDIMLMNRVVDFFDLIFENKKKEQNFLYEINFFKVLDSIKVKTKELNLIIVDEKLKKIFSKFK